MKCLLAKQIDAAAGKKMVGNDQVGQVIKTVLGGELVGCTDPAACNYDPNATVDDGLCDFESCIGCTDPDACNYDATATQEDGSCLSNDDAWCLRRTTAPALAARIQRRATTTLRPFLKTAPA